MWKTKSGKRVGLLRSNAPRVIRQLRHLSRRRRRASREGSPWQTLAPLEAVIENATQVGSLRHRQCGCQYPVFASRLNGMIVHIVTRPLPWGHAIISIQWNPGR